MFQEDTVFEQRAGCVLALIFLSSEKQTVGKMELFSQSITKALFYLLVANNSAILTIDSLSFFLSSAEQQQQHMQPQNDDCKLQPCIPADLQQHTSASGNK